MSLAETQAVLAELLQRRSPLGPSDADACTLATGNARLSPIEQVDIYRWQFSLRHVDVMREDFASIASMLGDEEFEGLVRDYLVAFPPSSFTLRDLGAAFPRFVADKDPRVSDLARLEWAFVCAFDAKDEPPFDPSFLATVPEQAWADARIALHPHVQRVAMRYPGQDYRAAVRTGLPPPPLAAKETFLVVFRGPETLQYIDVEADAFALLEALAAGTPLGAACEAVAKGSGVAPDVFQAKLGGWFGEWTQRGWLARVEI